MYVQNTVEGDRLSRADRKLLREIVQPTIDIIKQQTGVEIRSAVFIDFLNKKAAAMAGFCEELKGQELQELKSKYKIKAFEDDKYEVTLIDTYNQHYVCHIEFKIDEGDEPYLDAYYSDEVCEYITPDGSLFLREVYKDGNCTFTLVEEI